DPGGIFVDRPSSTKVSTTAPMPTSKVNSTLPRTLSAPPASLKPAGLSLVQLTVRLLLAFRMPRHTGTRSVAVSSALTTHGGTHWKMRRNLLPIHPLELSVPH